VTATFTRNWPPRVLDDLVGLDFELGARGPRKIDCAGVVQWGLRLLFSIEWWDPWEQIQQAFNRGELAVASCFPAEDWVILPATAPRRPADVIVFGRSGRAEHVGLVLPDGRVLQASEAMGSFIVRSLYLRSEVAIARHRSLA
jgi:cell wall-associated NlpC family hydrolase